MPSIRQPKRLVSPDLINFAARDAAGFVDLCERRYTERICAAADAVLTSEARLVMLTGPSSTGKTTSANRLAAEIRSRGRKCVVVSLDDFFVGEGRYPKRPDGSDDYECPEALDLPLLHDFMLQLAATGHAESPIFDFLTQFPAPVTRHIDCEGGVAIIEGLHALNPLLAAGMPQGSQFNIYASLLEEYCGPDNKRSLNTRDIRLARRMTRDFRFRAHPPEFTLALWSHVCNSEKQYVQAFRSRADLLLDTSFSYEPCLWSSALSALVSKTAPDYVARVQALCQEFSTFLPLPGSIVPADSMMREFIGPKTEK